MQGIWLEALQLQLRDDIPIPQAAPQAAPGEALLRILQAGICNTDLELVAGYYPFAGVLGHEFVAVVEQCPAKLCGQRVVGEINAVCGTCPECRQGRGNHCRCRTVLGVARSTRH